MNISCSECQRRVTAKPTRAGPAAIPKNWKDIDGKLFCRDCVKTRFAPRMAWFGLASVCEGYVEPGWGQDQSAAGWKAVWPALRQSWRSAARLYNWALVEFAKTDIAAPTLGKKGGPVPGKWDRRTAVKDVRAMVRARFPEIDSEIDSQAKYAILAKAEGDYFKSRYQRQILCRSTLPEVRSGRLPLPVPFASINRLWISEAPYLRLRISGQRFTLRLKTGGFHRQLRLLRAALADEGKVGQAQIQLRGNRHIMIGFSLLVPAEHCKREQVEVRVRTCPQSFWRVWVGDREEPWAMHEDEIGRINAGYYRQLQRLSDDAKMERRRPHEHSESLEAFRQRIARRHNARLLDHAHKATAILAGLCRRHRACKVIYDDAAELFGGRYPAFKLRALLSEKLDRLGVEFRHEPGCLKDLGETTVNQDPLMVGRAVEQ